MVSRGTCPVASALLHRLSHCTCTPTFTQIQILSLASASRESWAYVSTKYANSTRGLFGNFNSDPADDLKVSSTQEQLSPDLFGKLWRSGPNPWCVEGCLGGSCPECSSADPTRFSDPEACGKILEVNGPFRHCHGKVDPSSFYRRCVSDLCLRGGLQPALCHSLADYTAVCFSRKAPVYAWRSPGFCYPSCPSSTSYNMSSASVHLCLGWQSNTVELPVSIGENCLCESGLARSGNVCVSPESCGSMENTCRQDRRCPRANKAVYVSPGDTWLVVMFPVVRMRSVRSSGVFKVATPNPGWHSAALMDPSTPRLMERTLNFTAHVTTPWCRRALCRKLM